MSLGRTQLQNGYVDLAFEEIKMTQQLPEELKGKEFTKIIRNDSNRKAYWKKDVIQAFSKLKKLKEEEKKETTKWIKRYEDRLKDVKK